VAYLAGQDAAFEIVVVDDGSTDGTAVAVERAAAGDDRVRLIKNDRNRGKGYSVRRGVRASKGDVVLFSDADLSTPIEEFDNLARFLDTYDLVIASRSLPDSNVVVHQPFYREFMGRIFNLVVRAMLVGGIIDTQCGFKLMSRQAADCIFERARIDSFSFDVEMILIARRHGFGVKDIPVRWIDSRGSRVHPVHDSAHMLLDLLRIKLYDLSGIYRNRKERE
jgi:dolichyl-phosphate beta-glucosyltransferase